MAIWESDDYEESDDSEELRRIEERIKRLEREGWMLDSSHYSQAKKLLLQVVEEHKLWQYYKRRRKISRLEVRILAIQKSISIRQAQYIADDFNLYLAWLKDNDVQKALNKLTKQISRN